MVIIIVVIPCTSQKNENIESEAFERGLAKGKAESHDNPEEMNSKSNAAEEVKM